MTKQNTIESFQGEYRYLSNFYECSVPYDYLIFKTSEHAFQAAKAKHNNDWLNIWSLKFPSQAKKIGKTIEIKENWENIRIKVMYDIVFNKFLFNLKTIGLQLLKTNDAILIEGNTWGDQFWGVSNGFGYNHLGHILMQVRKELKEIIEQVK